MYPYARKKLTEVVKMIILASGSPRRKEILSELGVDFRVIVADTDESSDERDPARLTEELARRKGLAVWEKIMRERPEGIDPDECTVISADTVVCNGGEILGKPRDKEDAERMIRSISGRSHEVISGVAITRGGKVKSASCITRVRVSEIPDEEIKRYVESGEPMDKAGAYGIQGKFSLWVEGIDGCYFSVVGLPVNTLQKLYFECTGERLA